MAEKDKNIVKITKAKEYKYLPEILDIELTDTKEELIGAEIIAKNSTITTQWSSVWKEYDDIKEQYIKGNLPETETPFPGCSNVNMPIILIQYEGGKIRARKILLNTQPLWICEPLAEGIDEKLLVEKEHAMDYLARHEMNFIREEGFVFDDALLKGLGILEVFWDLQIEPVVRPEIYGKNDIDIFDERYGEKSKTDYKEHRDNIKALKEGKTYTILVREDQEIVNHPVAKRIPLRSFRIDIKTKPTEMNRAKMIGKEIEIDMDEIKRKVAEGIYRKKALDKIEKSEKEVNKITVFDGIYRYDINDDGFLERGIYTVDLATGAILRAKYYLYDPNHIYYIPHYIDPDADEFPGTGLGTKIKPLQVAENELFNQNVDAGSIANIPTFKARQGSGFDPWVSKWYPGLVFWVKAMADVEAFNIGTWGQRDTRALEEYVTRNAEMMGGVSSLMSGRETPSDPRAPAAKVTALLYEAGLKVGYYLDNLRDGLGEAGYQIAEVMRRYMPDKMQFRKRGKRGKWKFFTMTREDWEKATGFVPRGISENANKFVQHQIDREVYSVLIQNPIITKNPYAIYHLTMTYLMNIGGNWDRRIDKILPSEEDFREQLIKDQKEAIKRIMMEQAQELEEGEAEKDLIKKLSEQGASEEEATEMLRRFRKKAEIPEKGRK